MPPGGGYDPGGIGGPAPSAPGTGPPFPVEPVPITPPVVTPPVVPKPEPIEIDYTLIIEGVAEKLASDDRIKGPPGDKGDKGDRGPQGLAGAPGTPAKVDYDKLLALIASDETILAALEDRLNRPYDVLVVNKKASWWPNLQPVAESSGVRIVEYDGGSDVGPLPQLVRYVRGTPTGRIVGVRQVAAELGDS